MLNNNILNNLLSKSENPNTLDRAAKHHSYRGKLDPVMPLVAFLRSIRGDNISISSSAKFLAIAKVLHCRQTWVPQGGKFRKGR